MQYKPKYKLNKNIDENLDSPTSPTSICHNNSNFNSDSKSYSNKNNVNLSPYACSKFKSIINTLRNEERNKQSNSDSKNSTQKKVSKIQLK